MSDKRAIMSEVVTMRQELAETRKEVREALQENKNLLRENKNLLREILLLVGKKSVSAPSSFSSSGIPEQLSTQPRHKRFEFVNNTGNSYSDTGSHITSVQFYISDVKTYILKFNETKTVRQAILDVEDFLSTSDLPAWYYHKVICPGDEHEYNECKYGNELSETGMWIKERYPDIGINLPEGFCLGDFLNKRCHLKKAEIELRGNTFCLVLE